MTPLRDKTFMRFVAVQPEFMQAAPIRPTEILFFSVGVLGGKVRYGLY